MRLLLPPSRTTRDGAAASPERPPLLHYSGTLYKAVEAEALTPGQLDWAAAHLAVHSAEHGLVPVDRWTPLAPLAELVEAGETVVDLRSGEYVRRAKLPAGGWSVKVVTEGDDGRRLAVSHWNKLHKGVLVGALVRAEPALATVDDLLAWCAAAGIRLERVGGRQLELVV